MMRSPAARTATARWLLATIGGQPQEAPPVPWSDIVALASDREVLAPLTDTLLSAGVWQSLPDAALASIAARSYSHDPVVIAQLALRSSRQHVGALFSQYGSLQAGFSGLGVRCLPLKGMHQLAGGWWPEVGTRSMRDLDLLVRSDDVPRAQQVLAAAGYVDLDDVHRGGGDHHHRHPQHHPHLVGSVELHTHPTPIGFADGLSVSECWDAVGADDALLPDWLAIRHLVIHAMAQDCNLALRRVPYRGVVDLHRRIRSDLGEPDWDRSLGHLYDRGYGAHVDAFLASCAVGGSGPALPSPRNPRAAARWLRVALGDSWSDNALVRLAVIGLDRRMLANRFGHQALHHPWRVRARRVVSFSRERLSRESS